MSEGLCSDALARSTSVLALHVNASPPTATTAVCLVGMLRTFVVEAVHRSIKKYVIDSLAPAGTSDVYFAVGRSHADDMLLHRVRWSPTPAAVRYACSDMNVVSVVEMPEKFPPLVCTANRSSMGCHTPKGVNQRIFPRLFKCYEKIENMEARHGGRYGQLVMTRPDLEWEAPVPRELFIGLTM